MGEVVVRQRPAGWWLLPTLLALICALGVVFVVAAIVPAPRAETLASSAKTDAPTIIPHTIIRHLKIGMRSDPLMMFHVRLGVDQIPSESDMRSTAKALWSRGNRAYSTFRVHFYLPGMDTDVAYAYALFEPSGMKDWGVNEWALRGTRWSAETWHADPASPAKAVQ